MNGATLLYAYAYICAGVFVAAVIFRLIRIARMPLHLRWEIYPVGHEPTEKLKHGGSYMEDADWWTRPQHSVPLNELKIMAPEILLLSGVLHHNKRLWFLSFPFHFGLYCLIGMIVTLVMGAIIALFGGDISAGAGIFGQALHYIPVVAASVGYALGVFGTAGLLARRLFDPEMRDYTASLDIFNLALFLVTLLVGLFSFILFDPWLVSTRAMIGALISFNFSAGITPALAPSFLLGLFLIAYIPLTHMSHFFTKYFMYHKIRWDDTPNLPGGPLADKIDKNLAMAPTWSAEHIGADGKKTWVDLAVNIPERNSDK